MITKLYTKFINIKKCDNIKCVTVCNEYDGINMLSYVNNKFTNVKKSQIKIVKSRYDLGSLPYYINDVNNFTMNEINKCLNDKDNTINKLAIYCSGNNISNKQLSFLYKLITNTKIKNIDVESATRITGDTYRYIKSYIKSYFKKIEYDEI